MLIPSTPRLLHSRSRHESYRMASRQRERRAVLQMLKAALHEADPSGLIARPVDDEGWRRLVDRAVELGSTAVGGLDDVHNSGEGSGQVKKPRPKLYKSRSERIIAFIETFCRVPEGPKAGEPFILEPFERNFIRDVFDNPDTTRRAILSMAKKNGKTGLIAALVVVFLIGPEARANSQIVSGAMEREQAGITFNYALKIIASNPALNVLVNPVPSRSRMFGLARNVQFRALAAVAKSTHGISPVVAILDEIGQVKGPQSDFIDAVVTAQGAYKDGLLLVISTQAADDADLLSTWIDDALLGDDPRKVCHLYTAPAKCDVMDEAAWALANPGLDTIRSREDLANLATDASRLPSFAATFRNLNLNQRIATHSYFVPPDVWDANGQAPGKLDGATVYGGLDLASVNDLCSLELATESGDVHSFFWLPEQGLREKSRNDKVPYSKWKDEGFLFTTPGATVEYEHIAEFLRGVFDRCTVKKIAFDRQFMRFLRPWLEKAGFSEEELARFEPFGQGFMSMAPAIREFEARLLNNRLHHGGNPVLRMCCANISVERDAAGNRKFNKQRSTGRIDGMVALAMAIGVMPAAGGEEKQAVQFMFL